MEVICRIGSLETTPAPTSQFLLVICRIGSLETKQSRKNWRRCVICRIGSLEILPLIITKAR